MLRDIGYPSLLQLCQAWVQKLLLGARNLTMLSIHIHRIPGPPTFQHLPLRHLEIVVSSGDFYWLVRFFSDISRSLTLESLRVIRNVADEPLERMSMQLPAMHLLSMPNLKRIRLDNSLPGHELALPADCALFLDVLAIDEFTWRAHWEKLQHHTTVLQLFYVDFMQSPEGIQTFSNLQYLGLDVDRLQVLDLADLQHTPHVRVSSVSIRDLRLTAGSWQTLEFFHLSELHINITDVDSFVKDTRDFTFMSESPHGAPHVVLKQVQDACLRQGKACYMFKHKGKECSEQGTAEGECATYVILSTSKQAAEDFPVMSEYNKRAEVSYGSSRPLTNREDFWPRDPCDSVKQACA